MRLGCMVLMVSACGGSSGKLFDAAPDAVATVDVHGTASTSFVTDTGVVVLPSKLSNASISSVTPLATGFLHEGGTGSDDGTFVVPVGQGAASWDIGFTLPNVALTYLVGAVTTPDLSMSVLGRADATMTTGTNTMNVTGLAPWGSHDDLEITCSNAGAFVFSPQLAFATPLGVGATSISGRTFPWTTAAVEPTKGDTALLTQLATVTSGSDSYAAVTKVGAATDASPSATFTAALSDVPQDHTVTVHWKRSQFEALAAQAGPGATPTLPGGIVLAIDTLPGAATRGAYSASPDLVELVLPSGAGDLDDTFTYGDPFTGWDEFVFMRYFFAVPYTAPGAGAPASMGAGAFSMIALGSATDLTIAPAITGVGNITIGAGVTPTISWSAPATGAATGYYVQLYWIVNAAGATKLKYLATYQTTTTSLVVPDNLLQTGNTYALKIGALTAPGADLTRAPFVVGPFSYFEAAAPPFTP